MDVLAASSGRLAIATGELVAILGEGDHVGVLPAGDASPVSTVLPDSADCTAIATFGAHVDCLGGADEGGRRLKTWSMTGSDPTTFAGAAARAVTVGVTAGELVVDEGAVLVAELGTFWPQTGKGTPTHRRDGRIVRVDPATGAQTVLFDGIAPFALTAGRGGIAWNDMFDPERSVLAPAKPGWIASGALLDTTSAVATLAWGLRDVAVDADASGTVLWIASREPTSDAVLGPGVRARYVVDPREMPRHPTVDGAYVYWATSAGVYRRAK